MRTPKYHSIPAYMGSLDLYCSGEYPYTFFVYGFMELRGSFFAEPRFSANFCYFGGDIMLKFFVSRLKIIVF